MGRELLRSFACLSLCWVGAEKLLPTGRLRDAAKTVCGLLTLLLAVRGVTALRTAAETWHAQETATALTETVDAEMAEAGRDQAEGALLRQTETLAQRALARAGCVGACRAQRRGDGLMQVQVRLLTGELGAARAALEALGIRMVEAASGEEPWSD